MAKRLQHELRALTEPAAPCSRLVRVAVDESNIFRWFFLLEGEEGTPYAGGHYLGTITFPANFPLHPPQLCVLTPSGRFTDGPICTSSTATHPETWKPTTTVAEILLGLRCFMAEESDGSGSLRCSAAERRQLARASHSWNIRHPSLLQHFAAVCSPSLCLPPSAGSPPAAPLSAAVPVPAPAPAAPAAAAVGAGGASVPDSATPGLGRAVAAAPRPVAHAEPDLDLDDDDDTSDGERSGRGAMQKPQTPAADDDESRLSPRASPASGASSSGAPSSSAAAGAAAAAAAGAAPPSPSPSPSSSSASSASASARPPPAAANPIPVAAKPGPPSPTAQSALLDDMFAMLPDVAALLANLQRSGGPRQAAVPGPAQKSPPQSRPRQHPQHKAMAGGPPCAHGQGGRAAHPPRLVVKAHEAAPWCYTSELTALALKKDLIGMHILLETQGSLQTEQLSRPNEQGHTALIAAASRGGVPPADVFVMLGELGAALRFHGGLLGKGRHVVPNLETVGAELDSLAALAEEDAPWSADRLARRSTLIDALRAKLPPPPASPALLAQVDKTATPASDASGPSAPSATDRCFACHELLVRAGSGPPLVMLQPCRHWHHQPCVRGWLTTNRATCPACDCTLDGAWGSPPQPPLRPVLGGESLRLLRLGRSPEASADDLTFVFRMLADQAFSNARRSVSMLAGGLLEDMSAALRKYGASSPRLLQVCALVLLEIVLSARNKGAEAHAAPIFSQLQRGDVIDYLTRALALLSEEPGASGGGDEDTSTSTMNPAASLSAAALVLQVLTELTFQPHRFEEQLAAHNTVAQVVRTARRFCFMRSVQRLGLWALQNIGGLRRDLLQPHAADIGALLDAAAATFPDLEQVQSLVLVMAQPSWCRPATRSILALAAAADTTAEELAAELHGRSGRDPLQLAAALCEVNEQGMPPLAIVLGAGRTESSWRSKALLLVEHGVPTMCHGAPLGLGRHHIGALRQDVARKAAAALAHHAACKRPSAASSSSPASSPEWAEWLAQRRVLQLRMLGALGLGEEEAALVLERHHIPPPPPGFCFLDMLVAAMRAGLEDHTLQALGCRTLSDLALTSPANTSRLLELLAVDVLRVAAMRWGSVDPALLHEACFCIIELAQGVRSLPQPQRRAACTEQLLQQGVLDILGLVLTRAGPGGEQSGGKVPVHLRTRLAARASQALVELLMTPSKDLLLGLRRDGTIMNSLVWCLARFQQAPDVQRMALWAVSLLAASDPTLVADYGVADLARMTQERNAAADDFASNVRKLLQNY